MALPNTVPGLYTIPQPPALILVDTSSIFPAIDSVTEYVAQVINDTTRLWCIYMFIHLFTSIRTNKSVLDHFFSHIVWDTFAAGFLGVCMYWTIVRRLFLAT